MPLPTTAQAPAAWYSDGNTNVTTTVVRKSVAGGAAFLDIGLFKNQAAAATAVWLYVAVNALSNADEDLILASAGPQRLEIPIGLALTDMQRIQAPNSDPITRYAFRTDAAAESVGNRVVQRIGSLL